MSLKCQSFHYFCRFRILSLVELFQFFHLLNWKKGFDFCFAFQEECRNRNDNKLDRKSNIAVTAGSKLLVFATTNTSDISIQIKMSCLILSVLLGLPLVAALTLLKFIYSGKATNFCEIFTLLLSYVVPVKSKVKISQNFVAFSEYMNFNLILIVKSLKIELHTQHKSTTMTPKLPE